MAKRVGGDRQVCVFIVCMRVWMWMPALGVTAENKKLICAQRFVQRTQKLKQVQLMRDYGGK